MIGEEDTRNDRFKLMFKKFKKYEEQSENEVIDFDETANSSLFDKVALNLRVDDDQLRQLSLFDDFNARDEWRMYRLIEPKGLFVVRNMFTELAAKKWFDQLLFTIPDKHASKLKSNIAIPPTADRRTSNLRWITFGYHHDWDTKVYSERDDIPEEIVELSRCISSALGLRFTAEAGIINYYTSRSTLSPHTDHSEVNCSAPLLSLSFGSSAIFLVGGSDRNSWPILPLYLHNSDLLIMSEESRLSFHAIPKVFANNNYSNNSGKLITRINLNIRQVY